MGTRTRRILTTAIKDAERQNPCNYQDKDPDDFYISETEYAGTGLFTGRAFQKGDYLLSYRGDVRNSVESDSVYVFDVGKPENVLIDATERFDCKARFINDIDPYSVQNCHPEKRFNEKKEVMVCFFATKTILPNTELRYDYKTSYAPWRKKNFFTKFFYERNRKQKIETHNSAIHIPEIFDETDLDVGANENCTVSDVETVTVHGSQMDIDDIQSIFSREEKQESAEPFSFEAQSSALQQDKTSSTPSCHPVMENMREIEQELVDSVHTANLETERVQGHASTFESEERISVPISAHQKSKTSSTPSCHPVMENMREIEQELVDSVQTANLETERVQGHASTFESEERISVPISAHQQSKTSSTPSCHPVMENMREIEQELVDSVHTANLETEKVQGHASTFESEERISVPIEPEERITDRTSTGISEEEYPELNYTRESEPENILQRDFASEDGNTSSISFREVYSDTNSTESNSTADSETESNETDSALPIERKTSKKVKRPEVEECLICKKKVKKMRDHLSNAHKLNEDPKVKSFILSCHSTMKTKRCFQCTTCLKRMSFRGSHPKHHKLERIFNRCDEKLYPVEIQLALRTLREKLQKPFEDIVIEFDNHCQGLMDDGDVVSVSTMSSTLRQFLGYVVYETKEFNETTALANSIRKFMQDHNLKRITMSNYLFKLRKFFRYLELHTGDRYPGFKKHPWEKILDECRCRYLIGSQKEKRRKSKELYAKVPSLDEVQRLNNMVQDFLNKDLEEKVLHYKELSALNFLMLSFRLNCRAGPLLQLTWKDVESIKQNGVMETDRHKTGRFYDVSIVIENDQHKWLKRLKRRFVKEFSTEPDLVFPATNNKYEHSMAKNIKSVLTELFDPNLSNKDFHATAIRKMWDTHFHNNRKNYQDSLFTSHLQQTGHTAATALANYVVPKDRREVLNTYLSELSKLQNVENDEGFKITPLQNISTTPRTPPAGKHLASSGETSETQTGSHGLKVGTPASKSASAVSKHASPGLPVGTPASKSGSAGSKHGKHVLQLGTPGSKDKTLASSDAGNPQRKHRHAGRILCSTPRELKSSTHSCESNEIVPLRKKRATV